MRNPASRDEDRRMESPSRRHLTLELEQTCSASIAGRLSDGDKLVEFTGWIGFAEALERFLATPRSDVAKVD